MEAVSYWGWALRVYNHLPVTFSVSYVWREMWPLSFLFLLPCILTRIDFYPPAEINAFIKMLLLMVFYHGNTKKLIYLEFPPGCSEQFTLLLLFFFLLSTIRAFPSGNVSFKDTLSSSNHWVEAVPLWYSQPFLWEFDLYFFLMFSHWSHFTLISQRALNHFNLVLFVLV